MHNRKEWQLLNLPVTAYREALQLQHRLVSARVAGKCRDVVIVVEHPPVFTLGNRGGAENFLVAEELLAEHQIEVVQTERGGNITFHNPGQLVVYPIVDLRQAGLSVHRYVEMLEEVMIRTALHFGIHAGRNAKNRGIWVGEAKVGSVGIRVRRQVSFHGLALNVSNDLTPFSWMHPCGLSGVSVTSLTKEKCCEIPLALVRERLIAELQILFVVSLQEISSVAFKQRLDETEVPVAEQGR